VSFSLTETLLASFFLLHRSVLLCSEVSWISLAMAHILTVVLSTSLALVIFVSTPVHFAETEYIDVVTDKIQDLESSLFEMLGTNPLSVHFAEFSLRYGKRYDSVRHLVHSLSTFVKNAGLIESRNYITLLYTMVMNGNFLCIAFLQCEIKMICL
jgi:hypothetical protein